MTLTLPASDFKKNDMNYYKICITTSLEMKDVVIAVLSDNGFDGFEEEVFGLKTYIQETAFQEAAFNELAEQLHFSYKKKLIPDQNWNAIWEANFQPIVIGDFCAIRADFHPHFPNVQHEIIINPKMAFGTGHHATTHMMMELMAPMTFTNKQVFDFGCGTGILAILANKLGAEDIIAIDIDPLSYENTLENIEQNKASGIKTSVGEIDQVIPSDFDIILANINRNVILATLPLLYSKQRSGGYTLFSGILKEDETLVKEKIIATGFAILETKYKGEWICIKVQK